MLIFFWFIFCNWELFSHIDIWIFTIPGRAWANTLGIKNAKVYRISGLKKVDEYDIVDGKEVRKNKNTSEVNEELLQE